MILLPTEPRVWETVNLKESAEHPDHICFMIRKRFDISPKLFDHHPGDDKSIFMRQMDMIIKTFRTSI